MRSSPPLSTLAITAGSVAHSTHVTRGTSAAGRRPTGELDRGPGARVVAVEEQRHRVVVLRHEWSSAGRIRRDGRIGAGVLCSGPPSRGVGDVLAPDDRNNDRVATASAVERLRVAGQADRPSMVSVGTIVWLASSWIAFAGLFAMYFDDQVGPGTEVWLESTEKLNLPYSSVNTLILVCRRSPVSSASSLLSEATCAGCASARHHVRHGHRVRRRSGV